MIKVKVSKRSAVKSNGSRTLGLGFVEFVVDEDKAEQMVAYHTAKGAQAERKDGEIILDYYKAEAQRRVDNGTMKVVGLGARRNNVSGIVDRMRAVRGL